LETPESSVPIVIVPAAAVAVPAVPAVPTVTAVWVRVAIPIRIFPAIRILVTVRVVPAIPKNHKNKNLKENLNVSGRIRCNLYLAHRKKD
jgi:hypothetical protein